MARTKKKRIIQKAPHYQGFKSQGIQMKDKFPVIIKIEEYEAFKLCDYESMTQAEAAELMNISRPTFTRIYESVRKKIAAAFVEGKDIRFEGGDFDIVQWYKCNTCKITFTLSENSNKYCPFCKSQTIEEI